MALNVTVFSPEYPDNQKTVTVDLKSMVGAGEQGDEIWVLSAATNAYSDNTSRTAISDILINKLKAGWSRSSGRVGSPYTVTGDAKYLRVAIDEDVSEAAEIELDTSNDPIPGSTVAADIQVKIRALAQGSGAKANSSKRLSYLNARCIFSDNRFTIISGGTGNSFTGSSRSSVRVLDGLTGSGCAAALGFENPMESETLASWIANSKETFLTSGYTSGEGSITVGDGEIASTGDALGITDGSNTEYFICTGVTPTVISGTSGLGHDYSSGSKVQVLRFQDNLADPQSPYNNVDGAMKWAVMSIVNQIDFTS